MRVCVRAPFLDKTSFRVTSVRWAFAGRKERCRDDDGRNMDGLAWLGVIGNRRPRARCSHLVRWCWCPRCASSKRFVRTVRPSYTFFLRHKSKSNTSICILYNSFQCPPTITGHGLIDRLTTLIDGWRVARPSDGRVPVRWLPVPLLPGEHGAPIPPPQSTGQACKGMFGYRLILNF